MILQQTETKSLFVALIGRPNVGKSSLLNRLVGEKVAIVTSKPQTTRTRITGILTRGAVQYVFLDTPGIHRPRTRLGERMTKAAVQSIAEVDVAVMLFEPYGELTQAEQGLLDDVRAKKVPAIAAVNKTDTLKKEADFAARAEFLRSLELFDDVLALSVREDKGCEELLEKLAQYAVPSPHYFPDDAYTDMPEKALVAECVREKMLLHLREEIPHGTAVTVERFKERPGGELIDIDINIYCEKKSHKGIIIGKGGQTLKKIASEARAECEEFLGARVNLQCWVKIKDDWRDNDFLLNNFGFQK
ncbi:MAG TPA: GTPase Era [Candidatus Ruthenibacterium merdigallinarum]|nr:GTPase Era [Candidatus Ruthenibacterium merdigallinarum]